MKLNQAKVFINFFYITLQRVPFCTYLGAYPFRAEVRSSAVRSQCPKFAVAS